MAKAAKEQIVRVTKIFTFDMAHALFGYDGPCKNIHGHTYHLSITIKGKVISNPANVKNGMVVDFTDLKNIVKSNIIDLFDHALVLNGNAKEHKALKDQLLMQFEKIIYLPMQPSCENLLLHFKDILLPVFTKHKLKLQYVKLSETPSSYAEWNVEDNK